MANIPGKPFTDVLGEVENGELLIQLTEAVYKIVGAVMETRKPGRLKLNMAFSPTGKGTVAIDAKFEAVEPEHDRPTTTFFVGNDLTLMRQDPNQPRLPLRRVDDDEQPEPKRVAD